MSSDFLKGAVLYIAVYRGVWNLFNIWLRRIFCVNLKHLFPHLSSFFWERKKKDAPERRKKNRGQAGACRQPGNILRKQDIRGDTKICSHKYNGITGRLDRDVRSNKRLKGLGFLREGGDRNPHSLRSSLWFLSDESERNVKKKFILR